MKHPLERKQKKKIERKKRNFEEYGGFLCSNIMGLFFLCPRFSILYLKRRVFRTPGRHKILKSFLLKTNDEEPLCYKGEIHKITNCRSVLLNFKLTIHINYYRVFFVILQKVGL